MDVIRRLSRLLVIAALPLALFGCLDIIAVLFEANFYCFNCTDPFAAQEGQPLAQPKAGARFAQLNVTAQLGGCTATGLSPSPINVICTLKQSSGFATTSTFVLRDLPAGAALGAAYGAVILQLPASVSNLSGTYSGQSSGTLNIVGVTGALAADSGSTIVAEVGNKLWLIESPSTLGQSQFIVNFDESGVAIMPLTIKFMFVAKVAANGRTFYPPLFPCTNSFAAIPVVTLPTANALTAINLLPMTMQQGCNNKTYSFAAVATVDVVEYRNSDFDHYFVTPNAGDIALLDSKTPPFQAWSRTGRTFRAYPNATAPAGSVAVCRFFNSNFGSKSSHFFALHGFGCEDTINGFPDWTLEYANYFNTMLPDANSACAAGTVPLYRVYNQGMGGAPNHRFVTALADQQDMVNQGWAAEGVRMCLPP